MTIIKEIGKYFMTETKGNYHIYDNSLYENRIIVSINTPNTELNKTIANNVFDMIVNK